MTFLPIVERELRAASHRWSTVQVRMAAVVVATVVTAYAVLAGRLAGPGGNTGRTIFHLLSGLLLFLCLIEGARSTCDSLSAEKRDGTLGLLFLTDLRGYDVVLGKAVAGSVQGFFALLSVLPILVLSVPAGGVTGLEILRVGAVLLNLLVWSAAVGVAVSAFSQDPRRAFVATAGLIALLALGPLGAAHVLAFIGKPTASDWLAATSPVYGFFAAEDVPFRTRSLFYWVSLASGQGVAWIGLALASWQAPRAWQDRKTASERRAAPRRSPSAAERLRWARRLDRHPVYWLRSRQMRRTRLWLWAGAAVAVLVTAVLLADNALAAPAIQAVAMGFGLLLSWGIKIGVTVQVTQGFAAIRHGEAAELLLVTPLSNKELVQGHHRALWHLWLGPLLLVAAILVTPTVLWLFGDAAMPTPRAATTGVFLFGIAGWGMGLWNLLTLAFDVEALFWMGAWFAARTGKANSAAVKTLVLVQLVPSLFCFCGVARVFSDALFWAWAWSRLHQPGLRALAQPSVGRKPG